MKKKDFIDRVADKAELSKDAAARAVEAIFDAASGAISEAVRAGEHIAIPGFGRFRAKTRAARKGRNPQTGAEIDIPERTVVQFSPGKGLQEALTGKAASTGGGKKSAAKASGGKASGGKASGGKGATGQSGAAGGGGKPKSTKK